VGGGKWDDGCDGADAEAVEDVFRRAEGDRCAVCEMEWVVPTVIAAITYPCGTAAIYPCRIRTAPTEPTPPHARKAVSRILGIVVCAAGVGWCGGNVLDVVVVGVVETAEMQSEGLLGEEGAE